LQLKSNIRSNIWKKNSNLFSLSIGNTSSSSSSPFFITTMFQIQQTRLYAVGGEKTIKVPGMGDSISEGTIQKWLKNVGDYVITDEIIVSIETDKVVVEIRAPSPGVIKKIFANKDETVKVGADLYVLDTSAAKPETTAAKSEAPTPKASAPTPPSPASQPSKPQPAAPSQQTQTSAPQQPAKAPQQPASTPKPTAGPSTRTEHRVKMNRMRERIANRLKESQNTYAMLTTFNEVDMSNIMALREKYKDEFQKKHGVKLGFMSAFVKAAASALKEQPVVNAVIDGNDIVYRNYVDISVAVATPTGLVVPVIRSAEQLSFADIEKTLVVLGNKARDGKIEMEDMAGGTFTISNGGVYGSMMGTPIVNPPQSAILGMHGITKRAVVVNDQIVIRPMMYVALTYDHRLIDGREAVTFLRKIKDIVEDPSRLLLDV